MEQFCRFDLDRLPSGGWLCGVDEAGRGALAGPVVAGAVFATERFYQAADFNHRWGAVNDSKKLTPKKRAELLVNVQQAAEEGILTWSSGLSSVTEIEDHNILGATRIAMRRAIEGACPEGLTLPSNTGEEGLFSQSAEVDLRLIVDGRPLKPFPYQHEAVVKGDGRSLLIALASIVAKEMRDALMAELAGRYSAYDFAGHKGYGTAVHRAAILEHGPCAEHRALFLRKLLADDFTPCLEATVNSN